MSVATELRSAALETRERLGPIVLAGPDKVPLHRWKHPLPEREFDSLIERAHGLGLQMWPASSVLGLDFDGPHAWDAWKATEIPLPETARTRTRSGGTHLFFRIPPDRPTSNAKTNGRDLRRKVRLVKANCACKTPGGHPKPCGVDLLVNGYAIIPPTPGYSEDPDHPLELARMAVIPPAVLALARESERTPGPRREAPPGARIPQGERDATLTSWAGSMRRPGMSAEAILEALRVENRRCDPPLPDADLAKIAKSVGHYPPTDPVDPPRVEHLTDMGNARRLVARHGQDLRYCHLWGAWLSWEAPRWRRDESGDAARRGKATMRSIYGEASACPDEAQRKDIAKYAARCEAESKVRAMLSLAQSEPELVIRPEAFDRDPWLLTAQAGTFELRAGVHRPPAREDFITKLAPVRLDAGATAPTWERFLQRIFAGNESLIQFVQRAVGYTLTGSTREQCWFLLYGTGANGKTTFLRTVTDLLGDYAAWTPAQTFLARRGEHIDNDLARLRGVRMVACIETEGGRRLAEALVKQATGGDKITARFLFSEYFEYAPTFKLWLGTNHKPEIRGTDHATWRRVRLIPFEVVIPDAEQDRELPEKLRAEFPGILNWALEGCLAWQREGLGLPDAVRVATDEYRESMDIIGRFLEECCEVDPTASAAATDLYQAYVTWCEKKETPEKQTRFGEALAERGFRKERHRVTKRWLRVGLRLKAKETEESGTTWN